MKCCSIKYSRQTIVFLTIFLVGKNCTSGAQLFIVAVSVLANRGLVNGLTAWSIDGQLQLDDGGENS